MGVMLNTQGEPRDGLQHGYFPWELEAALRDFVAYYNNERYYESFDNMTPAGVYFGRQYEVLTERANFK